VAAVKPTPRISKPAAPLPDGRSYTLNNKWKSHFRVAILAVMEQGKLREAQRKDTCGLKEKTPIQVYNVFHQHELTTAVGGTDHHAEGHCHSSLDDKNLPRRNILGTTGFKPPYAIRSEAPSTAQRARMEAAALADLTRLSKDQVTAATHTRKLVHERRRVRGERYHVISAGLTPKKKCKPKTYCWWKGVCGPGSFAHSAVLIYREREAAAPELVFHRLDLPRDADGFTGQVSFVGFLPVSKSGLPWMVLYRDGCESWDFELYLPHGEGWKKRLEGSAGTTV